MPNDRSPYFDGMFSDHETLIQYARQSTDLAKLETDLQYISSMQHSSGMKSDVAISKGTRKDLDNLKQNGFLDSDFILLLKYDIFHNEQILLAQQYGAKAILFFLSDGDQDLIQPVLVSLPQFGTGDILTPSYNGLLIDKINISDAKYLARIPILPLLFNQFSKDIEIIPKGWNQI